MKLQYISTKKQNHHMHKYLIHLHTHDNYQLDDIKKSFCVDKVDVQKKHDFGKNVKII